VNKSLSNSAITIRKVTKKDVVLLPYVIKAHHKPTYSMAAHHVSIWRSTLYPMSKFTDSLSFVIRGGDSDDD